VIRLGFLLLMKLVWEPGIGIGILDPNGGCIGVGIVLHWIGVCILHTPCGIRSRRPLLMGLYDDRIPSAHLRLLSL